VKRYLVPASFIAIAGLALVGLSSMGTPASAATARIQSFQVAMSSADLAKGKELFGANCAACHGANGTGGVGPSLHGALKTPPMKRTQAALVAWIKDPKAPMPKLYPSTLNAKEVNDVAAYVLATFK